MKSFKVSVVFMLVALSVSADTCSNIKGLVHREMPDIKFYLVSNHPLYALINTIYPERGEQCFQSEQAAIDAGFFKLPFPKTDIIQKIRSTSPVEPMPATQTLPRPTTNNSTEPSATTCDCSSNIYNCGSFRIQSEAQSCYKYCLNIGAGDIHDLDRNNDGNACEDYWR